MQTRTNAIATQEAPLTIGQVTYYTIITVALATMNVAAGVFIEQGVHSLTDSNALAKTAVVLYGLAVALSLDTIVKKLYR